MRDTERVNRTRFAELGFVHDGPALWRFVDLTDGPRPDGFYSRVGPHYHNKTELLADLERYAEFFGAK